MAKYAITANPPTIALLNPQYGGAQGVLADTWWQSGALGLDVAQWESANRPYTNAIYNARGEYRLNYPVLRVTSIGPGLLGWAVNDFAALLYVTMQAVGTQPAQWTQKDLSFFGINPGSLPNNPPFMGHPRTAWVVAVKVVLVDDSGNPIPAGGTGQPPTTPPTTGVPVVSGNGGQSGGGTYYPNQPPTGYYPPATPPVIVAAPPPTLDPNLLTVLVTSGQQSAQLQAAREDRLAQLDAQQAQLDAAREERAYIREQEAAERRRQEYRLEQQQRQIDLEYRRQQQQLALDERRRRAGSRPGYDDGPPGNGRFRDDLY
jgi:hypothetical protein